MFISVSVFIYAYAVILFSFSITLNKFFLAVACGSSSMQGYSSSCLSKSTVLRASYHETQAIIMACLLSWLSSAVLVCWVTILHCLACLACTYSDFSDPKNAKPVMRRPLVPRCCRASCCHGNITPPHGLSVR